MSETLFVECCLYQESYEENISEYRIYEKLIEKYPENKFYVNFKNIVYFSIAKASFYDTPGLLSCMIKTEEHDFSTVLIKYTSNIINGKFDDKFYEIKVQGFCCSNYDQILRAKMKQDDRSKKILININNIQIIKEQDDDFILELNQYEKLVTNKCFQSKGLYLPLHTDDLEFLNI